MINFFNNDKTFKLYQMIYYEVKNDYKPLKLC